MQAAFFAACKEGLGQALAANIGEMAGVLGLMAGYKRKGKNSRKGGWDKKKNRIRGLGKMGSFVRKRNRKRAEKKTAKGDEWKKEGRGKKERGQSAEKNGGERKWRGGFGFNKRQEKGKKGEQLERWTPSRRLRSRGRKGENKRNKWWAADVAEKENREKQGRGAAAQEKNREGGEDDGWEN